MPLNAAPDAMLTMRRTRAARSTEHVDLEQPAPFVDRDIREVAGQKGGRDGGVVDQDVASAEGALDRAGQRVDVLVAADVELEAGGAPAGRVDRGGGVMGGANVGDQDVGAGGEESL